MNTPAVASMFMRGIRFRTKVILTLIQIFFVIFYGYMLYANVDRLYYLITYSCMTFLSLVWLIYDLSHIDLRTNIEKDKKTKVNRILRYVSWIIKATIIGLVVYQFLNKELSEISLIFLIVSIIALVAQIIVEIYSRYILKYSQFIATAVRMDIDDAHFLIQKAINKSGLDERVDLYLEDREDYKDEIANIVIENDLINSLEKINADEHQITIGNKKVKRNKVRRIFRKDLFKARLYYGNTNKLEELIKRVNDILPKIPDEGFVHDRIRMFSFFVKNLIDRKYVGLSNRREYYAIIAALIYLVDEKDIIPDKEDNGFVDDIFILEIAFKIICKTVFKEKWQKLSEKPNKKALFKKEEKDVEFEIAKQSIYDLKLAYQTESLPSKVNNLIEKYDNLLKNKELKLDAECAKMCLKISMIVKDFYNGFFKLEKRDLIVLLRIILIIVAEVYIKKVDIRPIIMQAKPIIKRYDERKSLAVDKKSFDLIK